MIKLFRLYPIRIKFYFLSIYYKFTSSRNLLELLERLDSMDTDSAKKLLTEIEINKSNNRGETILYLAACYNYPLLVKLLLEHGANPNIADYKGYTPLMDSVISGNQKIVRLLLAYDADPYEKNALGANSFDLAHEYDEPELFEYIKNWTHSKEINSVKEKQKEEITNESVEYVNHLLLVNNSIETDRKKIIRDVILSFIASLAIGSYVFDYTFTLYYLFVISIHELGHIIAMKCFGYKGLSGKFIPLFGAYVVSKKSSMNNFHKAIVYLAGPFPGLIIGLIFLHYYKQNSLRHFRDLGIIFAFINYLNLLPFFPLDGGRVTLYLLRIKSAKFDLAAKIIMIFSLLVISIFFRDPIIFFIVLILIYQMKTHAKYIRVLYNIKAGIKNQFNVNSTPSQLDYAINHSIKSPEERLLAYDTIALTHEILYSKEMNAIENLAILFFYLTALILSSYTLNPFILKVLE